MSATIDQIERLIAALERLASSQDELVAQGKELVFQGKRALDNQREHVEELQDHTHYLLRSERQRVDMDTLTKLFYIHTFKREGFDCVRDADSYKTVPIAEEKWKADTAEVAEASKKLREALDKFTVETPVVP